MAPVARLPARLVFGRAPLDARAAAEAVAVHAAALPPDTPALVVLPAQELDHAVEALIKALEAAAGGGGVPVVVARPAARELEPAGCAGGEAGGEAGEEAGEEANGEAAGTAPPTAAGVGVQLAGLRWSAPPGAAPRDCAYLWLGPDADRPALRVLHLTLASAAGWAALDPSPSGACTSPVVLGLPPATRRALGRRYYLVEKARAANIVGIVVGALGGPGAAAEARSLRAAARAAGKHTYTFLIGRPTPPKLANFPEVDVFVMVADPQGQLVDSKDLLAPVLTPFEARSAFCGTAGGWDPAAYHLDPMGASSNGEGEDGGAGRGAGPDEDAGGVACLTLAERAPGGVATRPGPGALAEIRTAADYLATRRTWRGLEARDPGAPAQAPALAVPGRAGRAAGYAGEPGAGDG